MDEFFEWLKCERTWKCWGLVNPHLSKEEMGHWEGKGPVLCLAEKGQESLQPLCLCPCARAWVYPSVPLPHHLTFLNLCLLCPKSATKVGEAQPGTSAQSIPMGDMG